MLQALFLHLASFFLLKQGEGRSESYTLTFEDWIYHECSKFSHKMKQQMRKDLV